MVLANEPLRRATLLRRLQHPTKVRRALAAAVQPTDDEVETTRRCLRLRDLSPWIPGPPRWSGERLPPVLLVHGTPPESRAAVAIVGARACDDYGRSVTARVARDACDLDVDVISGGAEGVDAAAHDAALTAGGRTTVVLGGGHDYLYPAAHRAMFRRIADQGGAVLSAHWPTTRPAPYRFLERNRVIAGLSNAVVVTRARARSGSLSTARHALDLKRPLLAVPGNVGEGLSAGPNALLAGGMALALTGPGGLAEALSRALDPSKTLCWPTTHRGDASPFERNGPFPSECSPLNLDLDPAAQTVRQVVGGDTGLDLDSIVVATGLPAADVAAALTLLQLVGHVESLPGSLYRAR